MGDRKDGGAGVCVRWMDTAERSSPSTVSMDLMGCPWVGDGKGRTSEMLWEDEKWCEAVAEFIM